eukprot:TRINITY_DN25875_c0_g1_i1.p1 TRINITY_DN25875_c0_g1~~TRINITY_DN25875_c0_g1_i1.p1  ORF type:complete len:946 (+),score=206.40 TRINITY_DN25875_c0_g1_i1:318-2840(+)
MAGLKEGRPSQALFNHPCNATLTSGGALLVSDKNNSRIRAVTSEVTTVCGSRKGSQANCDLASAQFSSPTYVLCLGINDTLFIADAKGVFIVKKDKDAPPTNASSILGHHPNAPPHTITSFIYTMPKARPIEHLSPQRKKPQVPILLNKKVVQDVSIHEEDSQVIQVQVTHAKKPPVERFVPIPSVSPTVTSIAEQEAALVFSKWAPSSGSGKLLSCTQWLRLLGHCRLLKVVGDTHTHHAVTTARAGIIFAAATGSGERMSFPIFCQAVTKLAVSLNPPMSPEKLILGCIRPLAGDPPEELHTTYNPSILKPDVLMLLSANETTFLNIFKWFVAKQHTADDSEKTKGRLLSMAGWLSFLRKFRIMPDLQGRQAGESFAVHAVSGTLFAALVRGSHALQKEMEYIKRLDIHKRPDAPVLLCFPEFLDAICRTAFACYGKTQWDLSRYPAPVDQLAALLNAMSQSEGADTFGNRPLFEVPITRPPSPSKKLVRPKGDDAQWPSLLTSLSDSVEQASESLLSIEKQSMTSSVSRSITDTRQDSACDETPKTNDCDPAPFSPLDVYLANDKKPSWPIVTKHVGKKRKKTSNGTSTRETSPAPTPPPQPTQRQIYTPTPVERPVLIARSVTTVVPQGTPPVNLVQRESPVISNHLTSPSVASMLSPGEKVTRFASSAGSDRTDIDDASVSTSNLHVEEVFSAGDMDVTRPQDTSNMSNMIVLSSDGEAQDDSPPPPEPKQVKRCPTVPSTNQMFSESLEGRGTSTSSSSTSSSDPSSPLTFASSASSRSSETATRTSTAHSPLASPPQHTPVVFAASAAGLTSQRDSSILSPISPADEAPWDEV